MKTTETKPIRRKAEVMVRSAPWCLPHFLLFDSYEMQAWRRFQTVLDVKTQGAAPLPWLEIYWAC